MDQRHDLRQDLDDEGSIWSAHFEISVTEERYLHR
jgi:hypothetical protein